MADKLQYFKDRVVVITGGGGGLGASLVRILARAGAKVFIFDINRLSAEKLINALQKEEVKY